MDFRRLFLYLALGLILVMLWTAWRSEHSRPPAAVAAAPAATSESSRAIPATTGAAMPAPATLAHGPAATLTAPPGPRIAVHTDVLDVTIALDGGAITSANLLKYPAHAGATRAVALLSDQGVRQPFLVAQPEIAAAGMPARPIFRSATSSYVLQPGEHTLHVPLTWHGDGLTVTRTLVFSRGSYEVRVETRVANARPASVQVVSGVRLIGANPIRAQHFWEHLLPKYWASRGPAYYDGSYEKKPAASLPGHPVDKTFRGGWIASVKQYFVAAAIPPKHVSARYFVRAVDDSGYDAGFQLPPLAIAGGASASTETRLFLGPKQQGLLGKVAPGLQRTVDYGKATIICVPLFWVLSRIHGLVGNWGWAIILLVLLIKAVFYWPQRVSARSMAKMRKLQPRLKLLQERYKDDRQKLSQATMELYRKEGANPVSGCLPMLIQVPIFFGLFYVLIYSVELRLAPWMLWIHDLSAPDPYYVLPVLYGLVSLVQFRLQPQAADNAQAKLMMFMPLLFVFFYAVFPSGLVLYYLLNTVLNVAIQVQVNREMGLKGLGGVIPRFRWPLSKG